MGNWRILYAIKPTHFVFSRISFMCYKPILILEWEIFKSLKCSITFMFDTFEVRKSKCGWFKIFGFRVVNKFAMFYAVGMQACAMCIFTIRYKIWQSRADAHAHPSKGNRKTITIGLRASRQWSPRSAYYDDDGRNEWKNVWERRHLTQRKHKTCKKQRAELNTHSHSTERIIVELSRVKLRLVA